MKTPERKRNSFGRTVLYPFAYGCITGAAAGAALALFFICTKVVTEFCRGIYGSGDEPLVIVCVCILCLLCCFTVAVIQHMIPSSKGSGIPLAEGAARGMLRVKWLPSAAALAAGSLLSFLSGLALGGEGPSIGIGGLIGDGVGKAAKKPIGFRRYLITGGACAGLATAFNAPLTGLCFAFEETHRRFSPSILAAALGCVLFAVGVSQSILFGFGQIPYFAALGVTAGEATLGFLKQTPIAGEDFFKTVGTAAICGVACAIIGVAFNRAVEVFQKLFSHIRVGFLRLLPVFILAATVGLLFPISVGTGEPTLAAISLSTAFGSLFLLLLIRVVSAAAASGAGATGGLFLPMIAVGGIVGYIAAKLAVLSGLPEAYAPNIVMICISAFFAATVRAPITSVLLSVELTASFVNLLPCAVAIGLSFLLAELTRTKPMYERMLEQLCESAPLTDKAACLTEIGTVLPASPVAYKRIRDILWPYNSLVTDLVRDGKTLVPDGETRLLPDDRITVRAENVDPGYFYRQLKEYVTIDGDAPPPARIKSESLDGLAAAAHNLYDNSEL